MAYPRVSSSAHARSSPVFPRITRARDIRHEPSNPRANVTTINAETAEHADPTFAPRIQRVLRLPSCRLDFVQRLAEDPDGGLRLPAREHERRREADRILPRPEHQEPTHECGGDDRITLGGRALLGLPIAH